MKKIIGFPTVILLFSAINAYALTADDNGTITSPQTTVPNTTAPQAVNPGKTMTNLPPNTTSIPQTTVAPSVPLTNVTPGTTLPESTVNQPTRDVPNSVIQKEPPTSTLDTNSTMSSNVDRGKNSN